MAGHHALDSRQGVVEWEEEAEGEELGGGAEAVVEGVVVEEGGLDLRRCEEEGEVHQEVEEVGRWEVGEVATTTGTRITGTCCDKACLSM